MGATTYELESSHVPMLSQPERVIDCNPYCRKSRSSSHGKFEMIKNRNRAIQDRQSFSGDPMNADVLTTRVADA